MISGHKPGDNITILNTIYHYPRKDDVTNKWSPDAIDLIWKDLDKGKKEHKTIYRPKYRYYFIKSGLETDYPQFFTEKENVDEIIVEYNQLEKDIAERTGQLDMFYDNIRNKNRSANKFLHADPRLFSSDWDINTFYRIEFDRTYKNTVCPVTKAYLDIEADVFKINNEFPQPGECPINAISLLVDLANTSTMYTFLLRDKENPKIQEFENSFNHDEFINKFNRALTDTVGGKKQMKRLKLDKIECKVIFYDDELQMIAAVFRVINLLQPDFVLAWNMAFDIPFIIERIKVLGGIPEMIMCHPDFDIKVVNYYIDKLHNKLEERGDHATISCYSVYLDQMIQFASRRKGDSAIASHSLDYVAELIAGAHKYDYHNITDELGLLPYKNYEIFVIYNMIDVCAQKAIEVKTSDIDFVFSNSIMNSTHYPKVHRQTIYLANRAAMFFWNEGFVIGNNCNKFLDKPSEKLPGAWIAEPTLVTDDNKIKLNYPGLEPYPINVFNNCNDFDFKQMYPSISKKWNTAPNTQIGRIDIKKKVWDKENWGDNKQFIRSGWFIEDMSSHNYLDICERWLNLASYSEMIKDILEYFSTIEQNEEIKRRYTKEGLLRIAFRLKPGEKIQIARRIK